MRPISRTPPAESRDIDPPAPDPFKVSPPAIITLSLASAKTFPSPSDPRTAYRRVLVVDDLVADHHRVIDDGEAAADGRVVARVVLDVVNSRVRQTAAEAPAEAEVAERLERRDLIRPRVAELRDEVEYVLGRGEPVAAHHIDRERQDVAHPAHAHGAEELSEEPVAANLS